MKQILRYSTHTNMNNNSGFNNDHQTNNEIVVQEIKSYLN